MRAWSARSRSGWAIIGWGLAFLAAGCAGPPPFRGSVLIITADALRPDYMSLNGYDRPTTPFLDSLIARGWYFEQATAPVPHTTPALASLLTGAYPHTTGVLTLTDRLDEDVTTLAELMRGRGYQTLAVLTNTLLVKERHLDRGFLVYDAASDYRLAESTTNAALRRFAQADPNLPVLAWIHYIDPHVPYQTDPNIARAMDPGYEGRFQLNFGWNGYNRAPKHSLTAFPEDYPKRRAVHMNDLPEEVNAHIRRLYAADILAMDAQIARLVSAFRDRFGEEILIVFTADHGESLGEHDYYYDHGDYVYNAGVRVPLAFILPDSHPLSGSGRCAGWVSLVDVAPTLLDLMGVPAPEEMASQMEGVTLVDCLRGRPLPRRPVFMESGEGYYPKMVRRRVRHDAAGRFRAVVEGDYKLIWTPFLPDEEAWELYHVTSDPGETLDLYDAELPVVAPMKAALRAWLARGRSGGEGGAISDQDTEALRSLGYIE